MHSPKESLNASAFSLGEPYSPISPLDPHLRTPSALARQLSSSSASQHKKSRSESSLAGDKRNGPRQLILTPGVAAKMSLAEMAWRRDSVFSHGDDKEHLQQQHFSLEDEMETLERVDEHTYREGETPYEALYRQLAISINEIDQRPDASSRELSSISALHDFGARLSTVDEQDSVAPTTSCSYRKPSARNTANHPYAASVASSESRSFVSLPEGIPGRSKGQRSMSAGDVNEPGHRAPSSDNKLQLPDDRLDAASLASWSHTMTSSLVAMESLSRSPQANPSGAAFAKIDARMPLPSKDGRVRRERALTEGIGQLQDRTREGKDAKALRSLKARASMWLLGSPMKAGSLSNPKTFNKQTIRSKTISGPLSARHVASGTLAPHINRESPFGRRAISPVQGYITVPAAYEGEILPALPSLFDSPALSSVSSAQSDGPATPTQHASPMQDVWAASYAETEAEESDQVAPHLQSFSKAGKMPISPAERERRRTSRRAGPISRPGSRSSTHLLTPQPVNR